LLLFSTTLKSTGFQLKRYTTKFFALQVSQKTTCVLQKADKSLLFSKKAPSFARKGLGMVEKTDV